MGCCANRRKDHLTRGGPDGRRRRGGNLEPRSCSSSLASLWGLTNATLAWPLSGVCARRLENPAIDSSASLMAMGSGFESPLASCGFTARLFVEVDPTLGVRQDRLMEGFHEGQRVWVEQPGGSYRPAVFVTGAEIPGLVGGPPAAYVVCPDTRSGEEVSLLRVTPREE
jgi:hypothetical protein